MRSTLVTLLSFGLLAGCSVKSSNSDLSGRSEVVSKLNLSNINLQTEISNLELIDLHLSKVQISALKKADDLMDVYMRYWVCVTLTGEQKHQPQNCLPLNVIGWPREKDLFVGLARTLSGPQLSQEWLAVSESSKDASYTIFGDKLVKTLLKLDDMYTVASVGSSEKHTPWDPQKVSGVVILVTLWDQDTVAGVLKGEDTVIGATVLDLKAVLENKARFAQPVINSDAEGSMQITSCMKKIQGSQSPSGKSSASR